MRAEIRVLFKFLLTIVILSGIVLLGSAGWYLNESEKIDKQSDGFAKQFYVDLLDKNYENIQSYMYTPNGKSITVEEVKKYLLGYEGMSEILQNPDSIEVGEFGDTNRRCIEVSGYDKENNYYYFLIDVKVVDDELLLDFSEQMNN